MIQTRIIAVSEITRGQGVRPLAHLSPFLSKDVNLIELIRTDHLTFTLGVSSIYLQTGLSESQSDEYHSYWTPFPDQVELVWSFTSLIMI
jgi:hypothetical protein